MLACNVVCDVRAFCLFCLEGKRVDGLEGDGGDDGLPQALADGFEPIDSPGLVSILSEILLEKRGELRKFISFIVSWYIFCCIVVNVY